MSISAERAQPILASNQGAIDLGSTPIGQPVVQWTKITQCVQSADGCDRGDFGVVLVEDIGYGHGQPCDLGVCSHGDRVVLQLLAWRRVSSCGSGRGECTAGTDLHQQRHAFYTHADGQWPAVDGTSAHAGGAGLRAGRRAQLECAIRCLRSRISLLARWTSQPPQSQETSSFAAGSRAARRAWAHLRRTPRALCRSVLLPQRPGRRAVRLRWPRAMGLRLQH